MEQLFHSPAHKQLKSGAKNGRGHKKRNYRIGYRSEKYRDHNNAQSLNGAYGHIQEASVLILPCFIGHVDYFDAPAYKAPEAEHQEHLI